jgi:prepilin-type N-terminal cleavage/methylation domain-containing protein
MRRAAFTLIEIMLAITIALLVIAIAVPAIAGIFGEDELERSFRDFDAFAQETQKRAVEEGRDFLLVWTKEGIVQEPRVPTPEDAEGELPMYAISGAKVTLERPFALEKKPPGEWPFWRSGAIEPVRIVYETEHGHWAAEYDPFVPRGRLVEMVRK